jgi:hypothetical protein
MLLGAGGKAVDPVWIDQVFSTFLYKGNNSDQTITTNLDFATEGGLTWIKNRTSAHHVWVDTERGAGKTLFSSDPSGNDTYNATTKNISSFTSTGFTLKSDDGNDWFNGNNANYSSFNFRRSAGFFDCITWTGDGSSNRQISHNLSSIPGCIIVKKTNSNDNWNVYHRSAHASSPEDYRLFLNTTAAASTNDSVWNETKPTSSHFTVGNNDQVNGSNNTYVAYLFAGGEEGYNSVDFDAATESLSATSNDYAFGTGNFTVEAWIKIPNVSGISYQNILDTRGSINNSTSGFSFGVQSNGQLYMYTNSFIINTAVNTITSNQWYHIALVNNGGTAKAYVDGVEKGSVSLSGYDFTNTTFRIANVDSSSGQNFVGSISNVRVVKGTAVYTSAFTAPTAPLTNITNTKLLCCNGDLTTSSTIASGTLSASGSPNTTGTSPFTSPDAVFGESKSPVIKCGGYVGDGNGGLADGNANSQNIELGFEPQWIMIKRASSTESWILYDSMRGIVDGTGDKKLEVNFTDAEGSVNHINLTPTGFTFTTGNQQVNANNNDYVFVAIRRSDGYVGKPIEDATKCFAISLPTNNAPWFKNNNFPVDLSIHKRYDTSEDWYQASRLQGINGLRPSTNAAQAYITNYWQWDYMEGWNSYESGTSAGNYVSYQFKRHKGFDLQLYTGKTGQQSRVHGLNAVPEMIWAKSTNNAYEWAIGHKDLTGGWTSKHLRFTNAAEITGQQFALAPTSTHWTTPNGALVNDNGEEYIAMLFSSVDGVSKCGSFDGQNSTITITTGFQPRFMWVKRVDSTGEWFVVDTTRGWGSGNDSYLRLDKSNSAGSYDLGAPTSTGFTLTTYADFNESGGKYIYYAHA